MKSKKFKMSERLQKELKRNPKNMNNIKIQKKKIKDVKKGKILIHFPYNYSG